MAFINSCIKNKLFLADIFQKPPIFASSVLVRTLASSSSTGSGYARNPLSILFKKAVRLTPGAEELGIESEINGLKKKRLESETDITELKNSESEKENTTAKAVNLESEKANKSETKRSLSALFRGVEKKDLKSLRRKNDEFEEKEETKVIKELSVEMMTFVRLLHRKGYFRKATFLRWNRIAMESFANAYTRGILKFAAEEFALDHQDIAKLLSGSNLKKIALFGCPTLDGKAVFSAKRLRRFFKIQEHTVCQKCVLKDKCRFPNRSVWESEARNSLNLTDVMRVIPRYGLHLVQPKLHVPDELHASVNKLLVEVIYLSQTKSSNGLN